MSSTNAYSERWQELFGAPPQMKLASAGDSGGGGGGNADGDLVHTKTPWRQAATTAGELRTSMASAVGRMSLAHEGVSAGTAGLASVSALAAVQASWEKRLTAVRDECGGLEPALLQVARDIGEVDEQGRSRSPVSCS
ncbi:hypothetical protein AB0I68_34640 [Streptomyces sp. NPDC050448]|uniref:hypothetical protein n=1 Tax=Streptomyces sp. NPDC050448 TaxID=3155404 RepID=UPI0034362230